MICDILFVNDINYESFTRQRAQTIQLCTSLRSFAIHRFHIWKRRICAFSVRMFPANRERSRNLANILSWFSQGYKQTFLQ